MAGISNMQQLFVNGAIQGFTDIVAPITAFSYATNQAGAALNDVIKVPFVQNTSGSSAFTYAAGYSGAGNGVTGKDITLNSLLYQPVSLTDADFAQLSPEVVARLGRVAGAKLGADVVSASFAAVISQANFALSGSYTSTNFTGAIALADLDKQANDQKWPEADRSIICGTTLWQSLLNNSAVNAAYAYGGSEAVRDGRIPSVFGFKPYKVNTPLPNSDTGFAVNPQAILLGQAWHQPRGEANTIVNSAMGSDAKTGLTIGFRSWYDPSKATTVSIIDCLFGVAKGDGTALIHIK